MSSGAPILVTGAYRSGTTWVGKMLALAPGVPYIHEPFSPRTPAGLSPGASTATSPSSRGERGALPAGPRADVCFRYGLGAELRRCAAWPMSPARAVACASAAGAGARPLVKDPIALLSAEWLAERFEMDVVVLIRHPAGFAGSLKRLGWKHSFATFLVDGRAPEVVRPFEDEIRAQAERPGGMLEQAALLWRILYGAVDGYRERHPDWVFLRHEDASPSRSAPTSSCTSGSGSS